MDLQQNAEIRYINIYPFSLLLDSCRAYQAVKCLVTASSKCPSVRKVLKCFPQFRRKVIKKCPRICGGFQIFSLCVKYPKLCSSSSAPVPSLQVRDHLILQPTKWQWAVNWLKSKMTESSSYWSPGSDSVMMRIMMNMNLFKICSHRFFFICFSSGAQQ